jgi:hypothetical protein
MSSQHAHARPRPKKRKLQSFISSSSSSSHPLQQPPAFRRIPCTDDTEESLKKNAVPAPPTEQALDKAPQAILAISDAQEGVLEELRTKYDVLVCSVISSTKIRNRVTRIVEYLTTEEGGATGGAKARARLIFLHGRPREVSKLITIVEKTRYILKEEKKKAVWQYNQLVEMPPSPEKKAEEQSVIEETGLGVNVVPESGDEEDEESDGSEDAFEPPGVFERAVNPARPPRKVKTLGVFLTLAVIPELGKREDVTVQTEDTDE